MLIKIFFISTFFASFFLNASNVKINVVDKGDLLHIYFENNSLKNVNVFQNLVFNECGWKVGFCMSFNSGESLNYSFSGGGSDAVFLLKRGKIYGYILSKKYLPLGEVAKFNKVTFFDLVFFLPDSEEVVVSRCKITYSINPYDIKCDDA